MKIEDDEVARTSDLPAPIMLLEGHEVATILFLSLPLHSLFLSLSFLVFSPFPSPMLLLSLSLLITGGR